MKIVQRSQQNHNLTTPHLTDKKLQLCLAKNQIFPRSLSTNPSTTFKIIFFKSDQHIFIFIQELYIYIQWGKKVFSQPPIVQVLPLKKMREACNFHHRYNSTMRDKIRKENPENHIVGLRIYLQIMVENKYLCRCTCIFINVNLSLKTETVFHLSYIYDPHRYSTSLPCKSSLTT